MPAPFMPTKIAGVYAIVCQKERRGYIGQTHDIGTRWTSELNQLAEGCHHNSELQADYGKHGVTAFVFKLLRKVGDPEKRKDAEHELIQLAIAKGRSLYNKNLEREDGDDWPS